jgi:hypothetical protein
MREEADDGLFAVWPENRKAVDVFCSLSSQWRLVAGMNGVRWQGLRYEAIEPVLRLTGVSRRDWPPLFGQLRVMESAARGVLNKES